MDDIKNINTQEEIQNEEPKRVHLTEAELNTERIEVRPVVISAFCPHCGREIKTHYAMYNPFTLERVVRYDCECGLHAELDKTYPHVVFMDAENNEYNAYCK